MKKRVKNALKLFDFPAPQSFKQGDLKQEREEKFKNHNDVLQFSPFGTKTSGKFKNMYLYLGTYYICLLFSLPVLRLWVSDDQGTILTF